jgi:hypothetical protein
MSFALAVSDREVFISLADGTLHGGVDRLSL